MSLFVLLRDHATTIINTQIPHENRQAIIGYCRSPDPTLDDWKKIRGFIVNGKAGLRNATIGQLIAKAGKAAGVDDIPSPFDVARVLKATLTPVVEAVTAPNGEPGFLFRD